MSNPQPPKRNIIIRLVAFLFGSIGFIGRVVAILVLGYGCFASAKIGTTEVISSTEATEVLQAGWPWTYSTREIVNVAELRSAEDEQSVLPIYDTLFESESALAADIGVFGVVLLLLLFTTKLFDRLGSFPMLVVFALCIAAIGLGVYQRSISENAQRTQLKDKLREAPGTQMELEMHYASAMDPIADRIHGLVYRSNPDQVAPDRKHIYKCTVQDLDAVTTEGVCALPLLKELTLTNCEISENALLSLSNQQRLVKLVLDGCNITGAAVEEVRALRRLKDFQINDGMTIDVPVN